MKVKERYPFASFTVETLEIVGDKLFIDHRSVVCEYKKEVFLKEINPCYQKIKQGVSGARQWAFYLFLVTMVLLSVARNIDENTTPDILSILGFVVGGCSVFLLVLGLTKRKEYADFCYKNGTRAFSVDIKKNFKFIEHLVLGIEAAEKAGTCKVQK